ncbi:MAG: ATP-binding cassette domain-containing protein, partial [Clostridia bacterium]
PVVAIDALHKSYAAHHVLKGISLRANEGDVVSLIGSSGSGKSTLLMQMKPGCVSGGRRGGQVFYDGIPLSELDNVRGVCEIGLLFQDADSQIVMDSVWHELAFSLENIGTPRDEMRRKIAEIASFFGLGALLNRPISELSGGQRKQVCLASILILQPRVLLLDEPVAALDPIAAKDFLQMLARINKELGITVIVCEHCLDDVLALADRMIVMDGGRISQNGDVSFVCRSMSDARALPAFMQLFLKYGDEHALIPRDVRETRTWAHRHTWRVSEPACVDIGAETLSCKHLSFSYDRKLHPVIDDMTLAASSSEILALLGGNGAGKTTFLKLMARIYTPNSGSTYLLGRRYKHYSDSAFYSNVAYLPQNPRLMFQCDTVSDEIARGGVSADTVASFGLCGVMHRHPCDLSGGQQQRLAIALATVNSPKILLLDEPTRGLDASAKDELLAIMRGVQHRGGTVVFSTHDTEFAARSATRCALLFDGGITASDETRAFFSGNYFYTTVIARALRDCACGAVRAEDVSLCDG